MRKTLMTMAATLLGVGLSLKSPIELQHGQDLTTRVSDLERRVAALEKTNATPNGQPAASKQLHSGEFIVTVALTNKVYREADPINSGTYEDVIAWDARYDFSNLPRSTRAIKGILEFSDLFGEQKFLLQATINEPVAKGSEHTSRGSGFRYNQFRGPDQWMRATDAKDMRVVFRVKQIIYDNGEQAEFK